MQAAAARQTMKDRLPVTPLEDRHTAQCRVLPNRISLLMHLPSDGIVAEIGAAFGEFSRNILAFNSPRRLHLIDMWLEERYRQGLQAILNEFSRDLRTGRLHINRGESLSALAEFDDDYFDWVYIDTNHMYSTTAAELSLARRKVKNGGFIAGHDYCTGNVIAPVPYGVIEAVHEFCVREDWGFRYLTLDSTGHFSFCLQALETE